MSMQDVCLIVMSIYQCSISHLDPSPQVGYNTPLGIDDLPLIRATFCPVSPPTYNYYGTWYQPCITDALSAFDITASWHFNTDNSYTVSRSLFGLGSGCPLSTLYPEIVTIEQGTVC